MNPVRNDGLTYNRGSKYSRGISNGVKPGSKRMLVTAGPTRERIDPIRFISNLSTGVMGYEIARAAKKRGYGVTLISGPVNLEPPAGVKFVPVESARQMKRAVILNLSDSDCLFMASAVCDWRPAKTSAGKIKRTDAAGLLRLAKNPDILYEAGRKKGQMILVGFALESSDLFKNAKKKLRKKNLDLIAANKVNREFSPFGKNLTDILVVTKNKENRWLRRATKKAVANYLIDKVEDLWRGA